MQPLEYKVLVTNFQKKIRLIFFNIGFMFSTTGLLQISMDGPNVNWATFDKFSLEVQGENCNSEKLLNVGSCGLHTLHNAFKIGMKESDFDVGSLLSSLHWLFKDSPARRDDYVKITGSNTFPLSYCGHRWLENVSCMERALEILPSIRKYVLSAKSHTGSEPSCKSFQNVKEILKDTLIDAKVEACLSLARIVTPILTKYQSDAPMLPFLANDLFNMIKRLLSRCIKPEAMEKLCSPKDYVRINLDKDSNDFLSHSKVDVGTGAKAHMRQIEVSNLDKLGLRVGVKKFIVAMVRKIFERSPIKYSLVRNLSCLDPVRMAKDSLSQISQNLSNLLDTFHATNRISQAECDSVKDEYSSFLVDMRASDEKNTFLSFDNSTMRLDNFLHSYLKPACPKFWNVVVQLLLLSHGQATVERGFSINKEISVENLKEHSLIAQRRIVDLIKKHGGPTKVPVNKELLKAAAAGRNNYQNYLEQQRAQQAKDSLKKKKEEHERELDNLKSKKARLEAQCKDLEESADNLLKEAETKSSFALLSQANALRDKLNGKLKKELDEVVQAIQSKRAFMSC